MQSQPISVYKCQTLLYMVFAAGHHHLSFAQVVDDLFALVLVWKINKTKFQ